MLFLIDVNGFCQHASNGIWIRYNDLYGNPGVLKEGTWTRALPKLNNKSLSVNIFTSPRDKAKAITNRSILEKQEVLYKILMFLRTVIYVEKRYPYVDILLESITVTHGLNVSMEHSTSDKPSMIFTKLSANQSPPKPTEGKPSEKGGRLHMYILQTTRRNPHIC